jgi:hypothetical protein
MVDSKLFVAAVVSALCLAGCDDPKGSPVDGAADQLPSDAIKQDVKQLDDLAAGDAAKQCTASGPVVIDPTFGLYSSVAIANDGKLHISYQGQGLRYLTNASGKWVSTVVDALGNPGHFSSLALDSAGKIHVSHFDYSSYGLKYTTNASGAWKTTTLDSSGFAGQFASLAIDANDKIHISYYDHSSEELKYATNTAGAWKTVTVDSKGSVGEYCSLGLDQQGKLHISYSERTIDASVGIYTFALKYATNTSGSWSTTTIESNGGEHTSLGIDSQGKVHISYNDKSNPAQLKYATNVGGSWQITSVDSQGDVGRYTSLGVDKSGTVHISYYSDSTQRLKYARKTAGAWKTSVVDTGGMYTSLGLGAAGGVHITYSGATPQLRYIVTCP